MFFPRLRTQAKWAFVFLILVFAGGFVFLGVGSGGLDLGQLLRDAFGNKGASTGSVSKAQKEVREHPRDPAAHRKLADLLEKKGRIDEAITALTRYTRVRPRDLATLRHLADLEFGQASTYAQERELARRALTEASGGSIFGPAQSGKLAQAIGNDPIATAVTTKFSLQYQEASFNYQTAATRALDTYKRIVKLKPNDQQALFSLAQAADTLQDYAVAVNAYKRVLEFELDPTTKAQIRARIKTLRQSAQPPSGG